MSQWSLALLGTPEVRYSGRLIAFPTRKALALLIYLAVEGGMHSREKLMALFWPESDEAQGRGALRSTLAYQRNALRPVNQVPPLIRERDSLGFDFTSDFDLDLHRLQAAFTLARVPLEGHTAQSQARHELLNQLQAAAHLYRGHFLEGFSLSDAPDFDNWVSMQREVWHRRMDLIFDRLSQLQFESGEHTGAVDTTTRWVAHDPLNEVAYRRLMQLHVAHGDQAAALQAYESCRASLAKELNVKPTPQTQALAEHIRAEAPAQHRRPSRPDTRVSMTSLSLPRHVFAAAPLVGRASEYVKLIEVYHTACQGQVQVVTLEGEAGIGKTRLATEFLGWAAAQGADILQGHAFETGSRLPYQPLVEGLRARIERENAPDDLLSDVWLAELSLLLPELRDRYPDLPVPTAEKAAARTRLFEAVARLFQALARRATVVLFLDDVQWADAASLDVLRYAGRRWSESSVPILVLISVRSEALVTTPTLAEWLVGLERDLPSSRLTLGALTAGDTLRLVQSLAHQEQGSAATRSPILPKVPVQGAASETMKRGVERFAQWLFTETGGHPFFMMETLKALLERGLLASSLREDGGWTIDYQAFPHQESTLRGFLPHSVREVLRSRLARLNPATFALLAAGAILDHEFSFEHLCRIAGVEENEGLPALDELLNSQLLREHDAAGRYAPSAYFFAHDKIRDVVYTEAGDARRRIFHRRAVEVLQGAATSPAQLAHHALAAGLLAPAFHFCMQAGNEALRLFAVRNAIDHYERAQRLVAERASDSTLREDISVSDLHHLYTHLGRAYELTNALGQARSIYEAMLACAQGSGTPAMECAALNHLAMLAAQDHLDLERAMSLLHQALQVAEQSGEAIGLAETKWNLAQLSMYRSDPTAALTYGEQALAVARQLNQQEFIARSLNVLSYAQMLSGCWEKAESAALEARALYAGLGDRAMEADCLCLSASALINSGRPQAGISSARTAHTISLEIENAWGQANSALYLAQGLLEMGVFAEALTFAELAVNLARIHGMFLLLGFSLTILGAAHRARLSLDAARTAHREAMGAIEELGLPQLIELYAAELCADCALAGDWGEAYTYAIQALNNRGTALYPLKGLTHWYETEALVRAGDIDRAEEDVRHFGERIGKSRRYRIPYLRSLAVLGQFRGRFAQAIWHLQEAATLAEKIGLPGELWSISAALGVLYQKHGDQSKARTAFVRAAHIVQSLANKIEDGRLRTTFLSAQQVQQVLEYGSPDQ